MSFSWIMHSGPVALFVLLLLLSFSVVSWAIIIVKYVGLRRAQRTSVEFADVFWKLRRFDEVFDASHRYDGSPLAKVFRRGYQELMQIKNEDKKKESNDIGAGSIEHVEHALRKASRTELAELESLIPFLATVGSTSPFIGLFGTVIGIMNSFHQIGTQGSASLATVAPGIAEALVATAAGLLAAIPAVIAFNYFAVRVRAFSAEMDTFSSDFLNIVRRHF